MNARTRLDRVASQLSALAREVDLIQRDLAPDSRSDPEPETTPMKRGRRHWTQVEIADLGRRSDAGEPIEATALALGRTVPAIYAQLKKLGRGKA